MKKYDVIIIGAGVSGMTAAIYLKRAELEVLLIEKYAPGGQVNNTEMVSNYPGFIDIPGPALASNFFNQIHTMGIDLVIEEVIDIQNKSEKEIITNQNTYTAKYVIIAKGRKPKQLGLPNEKKYYGRGISWCAICDGPLYKNKTVAVIGGGNTAIEEATYLSGLAEKVYLIHRSDNYRADALSLDKLREKTNVEFLTYSETKEYIEVDNKLVGIKVYNNKDNATQEIKLDGVFICIGYEPNTDVIKHLNIINEQGYILTDANMRTSIPGIYACGDIIMKSVYQITTAVGEGTIAATSLIGDKHKE